MGNQSATRSAPGPSLALRDVPAQEAEGQGCALIVHDGPLELPARPVGDRVETQVLDLPWSITSVRLV